jgi:hypothetical protein
MGLTVHKEFILAGQIVNSVYYCDVYGDWMKMCEAFALKFGNKRTGCCIMTMHHLTLPFSQENFLPKNMAVVPNPSYSSVSPTEN